MDFLTSPTAIPLQPHGEKSGEKEVQAGLVPSHGISVQAGSHPAPYRPSPVKHVYEVPAPSKWCQQSNMLFFIRRSTPAYESPLRHHQRGHSTPRQVKVRISHHPRAFTLLKRTGIPECQIGICDQPRRWQRGTSHQSIRYQAGDWQRLIRRGPSCSGSVRN